MSNNPQEQSQKFALYRNDVYFADALEKVSLILSIYSTVREFNGMQPLRNRAKQVLSYYIIFGHSQDTQRMVEKSLKISYQNLKTINSELFKMGVLDRDYRHTGRYFLSDEVKGIRDYFVEGNGNKGVYMYGLRLIPSSMKKS